MEVVEVCNCQVTGFRSQDSKRRETVAKHLEKRVWKFVSVCLGFVWMILTWGLRIPKVTYQRHGYPGILWGSIPIPRKTGHQGISSGSTIDASFPLLRWDDDDKRETVSNTKVSKWQTFSNKTLCRSCELSFKVVGYSERWLWGMVCWSLLHSCHCPMMITRWSQRDSFLIKHPSIWGHH